MTRLIRLFVVTSALASTLAGCASVIMTDNRQSTVLVTASCGNVENVGARCWISGNGLRVNFATPAEIEVSNSWSPLSIECEGDLLGAASTVLMPQPNWGMAGNLLVGGVPGALIDTATGRGFNYARRVNLHRASCLR